LTRLPVPVKFAETFSLDKYEEPLAAELDATSREALDAFFATGALETMVAPLAVELARSG
jgi:hypothetical protein